jgi:hypothetical protein
MLADDPELRPLADAAGVEPAIAQAADGPRLRHRANSRSTRSSSRSARTARSKMTVSLELDRAVDAGSRPSRPDRADRDRDRRMGNRRRRRCGRLRPGAAEQLVLREPPWGRSSGSRDRCAAPSGLLGRDARAVPRLGAARVGALPPGRLDRDRGVARASNPAARRSRRAHERIALPRRLARVVALARTPPGSTTARRALPCGHGGDRLPAADPVREGADALLDAVLAAIS